MINNKFFAIDSHCHIYPEKIASLAIGHTDKFYDTISFNNGLVGDLIEKGNKAGIDKFLIQSVATTPKQVRKINQFIANEVLNNSDRLIGLGTMHPESEDILGDIHHLLDLGLKGIKIHPDIQNFDIDDARYVKIMEYCGKFNIPILMHTGDKRYDHSNPNRLLPLIKSMPNTTFIGAHFGGWSIWEDACEKYRELDNFYVDCSSSFYYISKDTARKLILSYGDDKVLCATD